MKTIKTVIELMKRAEKKGVAVKRARQRYDWGYTYALDDLKEVYRVENDGRAVSLYHYGTLTARVDLKNMQLVNVYGESRSDADSINTFLSWLGLEYFEFGFKPVNGGFYLNTYGSINGRTRQTFLNRDGEAAVLEDFNGDFDFQGFFKSLEN